MVLLADADSSTVLWVGLLTFVATKVYDYLVLRETNRKIRAVSKNVTSACVGRTRTCATVSRRSLCPGAAPGPSVFFIQSSAPASGFPHRRECRSAGGQSVRCR